MACEETLEEGTKKRRVLCAHKLVCATYKRTLYKRVGKRESHHIHASVADWDFYPHQVVLFPQAPAQSTIGRPMRTVVVLWPTWRAAFIFLSLVLIFIYIHPLHVFLNCHLNVPSYYICIIFTRNRVLSLYYILLDTYSPLRSDPLLLRVSDHTHATV